MKKAKMFFTVLVFSTICFNLTNIVSASKSASSVNKLSLASAEIAGSGFGWCEQITTQEGGTPEWCGDCHSMHIKYKIIRKSCEGNLGWCNGGYVDTEYDCAGNITSEYEDSWTSICWF